MIISFTGHRPKSMPCLYREHHPWALAVKARLLAYLTEQKPEFVWSGYALGWDIWGVEAALALGIPFGALLPCRDQDCKWPPDARARYAALVRAASVVRYTVDGPYTEGCMEQRNLDLLNELTKPEDLLLALYNGQPYGGTRSTVLGAKARGIRVVNLWPNDEGGFG